MGKRNKADVSGDSQTKKKKNVIEDNKIKIKDTSPNVKRKNNKNKGKITLEKLQVESIKKDSILLQPDRILKKVKKSKIKEICHLNVNDASSSGIGHVKSGKYNRQYSITNPDVEDVVDEDSKLDDLVPQLEKTKKVKKTKRKKTDQANKTSAPSGIPKKILFVDDEPCEVSLVKETVQTTVNQKKFLNDEEAEVNDEDIDKFCDDLDDKDNEQYEIWVKLIEEKLHEKNINKKLK